MGKEAQPKRNVYVGGLEEQVNEEILHAAFVPFGDIVEVRPVPATTLDRYGDKRLAAYSVKSLDLVLILAVAWRFFSSKDNSTENRGAPVWRGVLRTM